MHKVLIANRGEIACRISRAAQALGMQTVAVFSDIDAGALHVAMAGQAVGLGGNTARESYLDINKLLDAATSSGADAVHPGYGFLAESADFARAVVQRGLTWVGPAPATIDAMGDKARARAIASAAGLPLLPGSARFEPGQLDGLEQAAADVGYPLLVKACGGGGGIGMKRLDAEDGLRKTVEMTQNLALRAFGDGSVFLERYIEHARHVEVQVFGFGDGRVLHLFERDCSIQRRFQKIVEEAPCVALPANVRSRMATAAVAIAAAQHYSGAGTVEFVVDDDTGRFYFLEMNTRIQVEHPVTEMITGLDLVQMQLRVAAGEKLALQQSDVVQHGHAIEMRLYAENPAKNFLPSAGTLTTLQLPTQTSMVRVDTGFRQGDTVSPYYDPMLAKVIVCGTDRSSAIATAQAALEQVRIEGPANNLAFLQRVLAHPVFQAGQACTTFLAAHRSELIDV